MNFDDIFNEMVNKLKSDMYISDFGDETIVHIPVCTLVELLTNAMKVSKNIKDEDFRNKARDIVNMHLGIDSCHHKIDQFETFNIPNHIGE